MSKPFDATTKHLVEASPRDWLAFVGRPTDAPVEVIDADLATDADRVLRVNAAKPWLLHLEFQASRDADLPERTLRYNVLLRHRYELPTKSVVVLLRAEADGTELRGELLHEMPDEEFVLLFRYSVVRVWGRSPEEALWGGLGTLPLAPLTNISLKDLPDLISRMEERIHREATPQEAKAIWTATYALMGMRYPAKFVEELLKGVNDMKESTTYQAILKEGRKAGLEQGRKAGRKEGRPEGRQEGRQEGEMEEARAILLRLGGKRFGAPDAQTQAAIAAVALREKLETLTERVLDVESWSALLAEI